MTTRGSAPHAGPNHALEGMESHRMTEEVNDIDEEDGEVKIAHLAARYQHRSEIHPMLLQLA